MAVLLSVGIDVGSDFSFMTILDSSHNQIGKTLKIFHDVKDSLDSAVLAIKKAEEISLKKATIFLESTGIYHLPLYAFLSNSGFDTRIINPLISHSNRNSSVRKVKNDKFDSINIAELGLNPKTKYSYTPNSISINIRALAREYYSLVDTRTEFVNKLGNSLHIVFPGYSHVFSDVTGLTSFTILKTYCTPNDILNADKDALISLIATTSRKGLSYAQSKYELLINAATLSSEFSYYIESQFFIIKSYLSIIDGLNASINSIVNKMLSLLDEFKDTTFVKQVLLLSSIKGVGFLSAVTIMAEISDFSLFKTPKQLFAYFGIDPSVNESGHFKGTKNHMSKRGSRIARRAIYAIALASIRTSCNGIAINPTLSTYYKEKCISKAKKVALGAVMHKVCNIIFAVLRDNKPFKIISNEEHIKQYYSNNVELKKSA